MIFIIAIAERVDLAEASRVKLTKIKSSEIKTIPMDVLSQEKG